MTRDGDVEMTRVIECGGGEMTRNMMRNMIDENEVTVTMTLRPVKMMIMVLLSR